MQKLGDGAKPFTLSFPQSAPNSVLIRGEEGDSAAMGVSYEVKLHVGDSSEDHVGTKKASVHMSIRKVGFPFQFWRQNHFHSNFRPNTLEVILSNVLPPLRPKRVFSALVVSWVWR